MRTNVELLAPAGSFEALQAAVQNGCDAVYLGGTMFGARAFAHNFDDTQMETAVKYAHVYGVRVYVTVNTLLYEKEMEEVIAYVKRLQDMDVDALIIQDVGLFTLLHERFPDMELHASTQMHIHNPQGIAMLQEMGAARVVVPRETTIEEIREYAKLGVDLEVFVQGALCVSYSGQCLMSSLTLARSGNRGECAQSCRMQYTLEEDHHGLHKEITTKGQYLLSPKDLNTLEQVPTLIEAGIASFKIEGRMKRPEYVALMCALYRKAIDAYTRKETFHVDAAMKQEMEKVFHRGFTSGHLFHQVGSALMNPLRPNHMGVRAGIIEQISKDKMTVKLVDDLHQGDGVRILKAKGDEGFRVNRMYQNGLLVNHAKKNERIQLDKTGYVEKGSILLKTSDCQQLEALRASYEQRSRTIPIQASFSMQLQKKAKLIVKDEQQHQVEVFSDMPCEKAMKTPLSKERILAQLQKTKDTPFAISCCDMSNVVSNGILPIKELNRMRRKALEQLQKLREVRNGVRRFAEEKAKVIALPSMREVMIVVHTKEQYEVCRVEGYSSIYIEDVSLYQTLRQANETVYLREERVKKDAYTQPHTLIQETAGLSFAQAHAGDTSLNITNSYSAAFAFANGVDILTLSVEHTPDTIQELTTAFQKCYHRTGNFAVQLYGHVELMLSEYCPIQACLKDDGKKQCGLCRKATRYNLKDLKGHRYPILSDVHCRIHLLSEDAYDHIAEWKAYQKLGITSALIVFTIEDAHKTRRVLRKVKEQVHVD